MRDLLLRLALLWVAVLGPVVAYGPRAAAEEVSYWYAYVLEGEAEKAGLDYDPMVAVGCASKMNTGNRRCNIDEFLRYLWAEQVGNNGQLKNTPYPQGRVGIDDPDTRWDRYDLSRLFNQINRSGFVDGVRGNRLVKGVNNFWTARRRVMEPLANLEARIGDFGDEQDRVQGILNKAKQANTSAYMMRLMDYERYRIRGGSLNTQLGGGRQVATKPLDTGIRGYTFEALDAERTLTNYPDLTREELQEACNRVRELPHNAGHWVALQEGRAAVTNGACVLDNAADIMLK